MATSGIAQTARNGQHDHPDHPSPASSSKDKDPADVEGDEEDEANEQDPDQPPIESLSPSSAPRQPVSLLDLPNELLEKILKLVYNSHLHVGSMIYLGSKRRLAGLALVCKVFLPIARHLLYSAIEFRFFRIGEVFIQQQTFDHLRLTLTRNAHLVPFVNKVSSSVTSVEDADDLAIGWHTDVNGDHEGWDEDWLAQFSKDHSVDMEGRLSSLFSLLQNQVQELDLFTLDVPYDFQPVLSSCTFPRLTILRTPTFTPSVALSCPSLVSLTVASVDPLQGSSPACAPVLERLDAHQNGLSASASTLDWLTSASHTSLRALVIPYTDSIPPPDFLTRFTNLSHLTLNNNTFARNSPRLPSTRPLPALPPSIHTLTIAKVHAERHLTDSPAATHLDQTFLSNLTAPSIRTLILHDTAFSANVYLNLLSNPAHLPALEVFDLRRASFGPSMERTPGWETAASDLERVCAQRGVELRMRKKRKRPLRRIVRDLNP
ncbi:hypothetical protein JCM8097_005545 [Rhodosporidiobolus ruineniae]